MPDITNRIIYELLGVDKGATALFDKMMRKIDSYQATQGEVSKSSEKMQQLLDMSRIEIAQTKLNKQLAMSVNKIDRMVNIPIDNVPNALKRLNLEVRMVDGQARVWDRMKDKFISNEQASKRLASANKRFRMEWLSVMFLGMAIQRLFGGINKSVDDLTGTTEIMNTTWQILGLEAGLQVQDTMLAISDALLGLPQPMQDAIGWGIRLGDWAGGALATFGQMSLGIKGLKDIGVLGAIETLGGKIKDFIKDPVDSARDAWGLLGDKFATIKDNITDGLGSLKDKLASILPDSVGDAFSTIKDKAIESIDAINSKMSSSAAVKYSIYFGAILAGMGIGAQLSKELEEAFPGISANFTKMLRNIPFLSEFLLGVGMGTMALVGPPANAPQNRWQAIEDLAMRNAVTRGIKTEEEYWQWRNAHPIPGWTPPPLLHDFIMRPGMSAPVSFSPQDTVVGFKGQGPSAGNLTYSPSITIQATISSDFDVRSLGRRLAEVNYQEMVALGGI